MKAKEMRQKSKDELEKIIKDDREKIRQLRFNLSSGKVKNIKEAGNLKKKIARVLTILKERG